jgi:hypothetical protein
MTSQSSSLKPLGQWLLNLVGMCMGWSSTNFFFFFISLQSEIRHKNKIPQVAKRMFSVFCLLNVYFSTNFDNI